MSEQYARKVDQHLSYARSLLGSARRFESSHDEQAHTQGALLQLNLAWSYYLWELDARYGLKPSPSPQWGVALSDATVWRDAAEGREIAALLHNSHSWLSAMQKQLQAIWQVGKHTGLTGELFAYQESHADLIATASSDRGMTSSQVQDWAESFQAMLQRQRGNQEEY